MKNYFFFCLLISSTLTAQLRVTNLLTENLPDPAGIDASKPRFSWQLNSTTRNTRQSAYELNVMLDQKAVW